MAHEINTPIQFVGSNTSFLQLMFRHMDRLLAAYDALLDAAKRGEVPQALIRNVERVAQDADLDYARQEIPKAIEQSLEGVERVARIVRSMRELSHPGRGQKTPVDLNQVIDSTITVARNEWKYIAEMVTEFDTSLPLVPCLEDEIRQVILNMVLNAAQAISEAVGDGSRGKGTITVRSRRHGAWAEITIRDTGCGIPEAVRSRIFEPFFTTKPVGKGTGQGLAIARSVVVERHNGTITFETQPGSGTTFIIRLPIRERPRAPTEQEVAHGAPYPAGR
jgi:signal transduction histidine kinase